MEINGIILINKERGISSNSVVNKVKHILKCDKAGHLGTLDVLGEGLLPVTLGKGTKLFDMFLSKDKVYRTVFRFGQTTKTLDLEGEITEKDDKIITSEMIEKVLPKFIGKQSQMPPQYSAKKVNGQKAYELARAGIEVELKPKEIEIYSIQLVGQTNFNSFEFIVHCSSGTFIRSLCRDIATALSTYGVMSFIQRTRCGMFDLKDSFTIEDVKNGKFEIIRLDKIFDYQNIVLQDDLTLKLLNGVKIDYEANNGLYKIYSQSNFLGIGEIENNKLKFYLRLI
jgi:tRNA pseudouridine55 synthase